MRFGVVLEEYRLIGDYLTNADYFSLGIYAHCTKRQLRWPSPETLRFELISQQNLRGPSLVKLNHVPVA